MEFISNAIKQYFWLLALFAIIWWLILFVFEKKRKESLSRLAEVLDGRRFKMEGSTTMSGLFQGLHTQFHYESGGPMGGNGASLPSVFQVTISCHSPFTFKISKRSKISKLLGFSTGVKTGDPELDSQLVFGCDAAQSFIDWMGRSEVKEKVASLVLANGVDSLELKDGFLKACCDRSGLKPMMQPWNVRQTLQKLQALAHSLESIM